MIELRFRGRGGQGAVTAVDLLAQAPINRDMYVQAFPNFGPEQNHRDSSAEAGFRGFRSLTSSLICD